MSVVPVNHFQIIHNLFEAGSKLEAKIQTTATAATFYHRFFQECSADDYDPNLIAATSMYLAGKAEEDHLKIRDIVNVFLKNSHPNSEPLELGEEYWALRDSIVQGELFLMRMLKFKVSVDHPHKYLLHFLKSLYDWFDPKFIHQYPLVRTCWSLLCDHYHNPICLKYKPAHVAIAIINIALHSYGISVPYSEEATISWYEAFSDDLSKDHLWEVMEAVMTVYDAENSSR